MPQSILTSAIAAAEEELIVVVADTPALVHEAHSLRHQVYCLERGYEPSLNGLEIDAFDSHSRHVILRLRRTGDVIGTARLIMPLPQTPMSCFPMQAVCDPIVFTQLPPGRAVEVSRFAISKERRGLSAGALSLSRIALVRGLVELSRQQGVTHWCAMMERTLLRLLRATAIHFEAVGPLVEFHGLRQPASCELDGMLARMRREMPEIWEYVTGDSLRVEQPARFIELQNEALRMQAA